MRKFILFIKNQTKKLFFFILKNKRSTALAILGAFVYFVSFLFWYKSLFTFGCINFDIWDTNPDPLPPVCNFISSLVFLGPLVLILLYFIVGRIFRLSYKVIFLSFIASVVLAFTVPSTLDFLSSRISSVTYRAQKRRAVRDMDHIIITGSPITNIYNRSGEYVLDVSYPITVNENVNANSLYFLLNDDATFDNVVDKELDKIRGHVCERASSSSGGWYFTMEPGDLNAIRNYNSGKKGAYKNTDIYPLKELNPGDEYYISATALLKSKYSDYDCVLSEAAQKSLSNWSHIELELKDPDESNWY